VDRVSKLEFLGNDIRGLDFGMNDKQLFSAREECLGYLTLEVSVSSILIPEGIEYAKRCGRDFETRTTLLSLFLPLPVAQLTTRTLPHLPLYRDGLQRC
jgi:hypothetical protein